MTGRSRRPAARPPRPGRRLAVGLGVSVVLVVVLLVGVFPTRDWLDQREQSRERQAELEASQAEQRQLEERIAELQTPEEIEAIGRDEYGLVRPGEEAYAILPESVPPVELPDTWPFVGAEEWLNR